MHWIALLDLVAGVDRPDVSGDRVSLPGNLIGRQVWLAAPRIQGNTQRPQSLRLRPSGPTIRSRSSRRAQTYRPVSPPRGRPVHIASARWKVVIADDRRRAAARM